MRAGRLDQNVAFDEPVTDQSPSGSETMVWTERITVRARIEPISGSERLRAEAITAAFDARIVVRWLPMFNQMTAKWRARHLEKGTVYNIAAPPSNIGIENREIEILANTGLNEGQMVAKVTVKVEGLQRLGENMRTLAANVALKISRRTANAGAQVLKKRAVHKVITNPSVDTGSLRDAIVVKRATQAETTPLSAVYLVAVRTRQTGGKKRKTKQATAPHAHFIEFGTVKMAAEPFMRPAFDEGKEEALNAMVDAMQDGIDKAIDVLPK